jgi:uncharacterized protein (TIGR00266 family)
VQHAITHGPSFAMLRVDLAPGETIVGEAGAMVARHQQLTMDVKLNASPAAGFFAKVKSLFIALVRRVIGGETFFVNHFSAPQGGSVWLAPPMAGQIVYRRLNGELLLLSTGAYLAHAGNVELKLKWGGLRGLFAKEGAFFLGVTGHGDLWFTSYGGVETIDVNGSYIVDNGHLVGYEGNLTFSIRSAGGGLLGFAASGEGLVCEFQGQGRVWIQTRNLGTLVDWLSPMLPG